MVFSPKDKEVCSVVLSPPPPPRIHIILRGLTLTCWFFPPLWWGSLSFSLPLEGFHIWLKGRIKQYRIEQDQDGGIGRVDKRNGPYLMGWVYEWNSESHSKDLESFGLSKEGWDFESHPSFDTPSNQLLRLSVHLIYIRIFYKIRAPISVVLSFFYLFYL